MLGSAQKPGAAPTPTGRMPSGPTAADRTLAALRVLLRSSHLAGPDDLPALVSAASAELGAGPAVLYLVDHDQVTLVPLAVARPSGAAPAAEGVEPDAALPDDAAEPLVINGTLAGRAYSDSTQLVSTTGSGLTVWTPVVDGTERQGVLRLDFPQAAGELASELLAGCEDVAALLAEMVATRSVYGDAFERARRRSR